MVRFLHTSDWQIGMKGAGLGRAAAVVSEQRIATVARVLDLARTHEAAFVVAAGDLFEDNRVSAQIVDEVARILRSHPDVEVHAIPGNHDLPGPGSVWNRPALTGVPNLAVHEERTPVVVCDGDAILHPFPVTSRYTRSDPLEGLEDVTDRPGVHVGIAHGHLTTISFGVHEDDVKLPLCPDHVDRSGLDYLALGHFHGTRLVSGADGHVRIAYSGTHEQTAYSERDAGNVLLVEIEGKRIPPRVTPIPSGVLTWAREEMVFAGDTNLDRLRSLLDGCHADLLRLDVSGELPARLERDYRDLCRDAAQRLRDLRVRDPELRWRSEEADLECPVSDTMLSQVHTRLAGRLAEASGDDAAVLREAIGLLQRMAREAGL